MLNQNTPSTISFQLNSVTLYDLKQILFSGWLYSDIDFIFEDDVIPSEAFNTLRRISDGLRAVSIMCANDPDRDRLWHNIKTYLEHMIEAGWHLMAGNERGYLCVRIIEPRTDDTDKVIYIDIPSENIRQLRGIDSWLDSFSLMN